MSGVMPRLPRIELVHAPPRDAERVGQRELRELQGLEIARVEEIPRVDRLAPGRGRPASLRRGRPSSRSAVMLPPLRIAASTAAFPCPVSSCGRASR